RMRPHLSLNLQRAFRTDRIHDFPAFRHRSRRDMDIAENIVVLSAFMRDHTADAAGANDQDIAFHRLGELLSRSAVRTGSSDSPHRQIHGPASRYRQSRGSRWTAWSHR